MSDELQNICNGASLSYFETRSRHFTEENRVISHSLPVPCRFEPTTSQTLLSGSSNAHSAGMFSWFDIFKNENCNYMKNYNI
jgi:hypothetical protein